MRAVLDPNVLIAALLSRDGAPAQLVARWLGGEFELVVSRALLDELRKALDYPKLRLRVSPEDADAFVALIEDTARVEPDPLPPPQRSPDQGDDYLLALAESTSSVLVSGDGHLLQLAPEFPVVSPRAFVDRLNA